jgi:hypothetical protein
MYQGARAAVLAPPASDRVLELSSLRGFLAGAPTPAGKMERLSRIAAAASAKVLWLGAVAAGMMILGNIMIATEELAAGQVDSTLLWPVCGMALGALLLNYFAYLAVLKRMLARVSD